MAEFVEHGAIDLPGGELREFADSLYGYLYFKLNMGIHRPNTSEHFEEIIGNAVIFMQRNAKEVNSDVIDYYGLRSGSLLVFCQDICDLYPNDDYFKKLYYMSAFILEVMIWFYCLGHGFDCSYGPRFWITIFRNNFENEFEHHGGWRGLAEAGHRCLELDSNDCVPFPSFLPSFFHGGLASVSVPTSLEGYVDETIEAFNKLQLGPLEDASVDEEAQVEREGEKEENQPGKVKESTEESEENRAQEIDVGAFPHSSALGGDVVYTDTPMEGTSEKSEESTHSCGTRSRQKRRHDTPPNNDSDTEQAPSKAKLDRK